MAEEAVSEALRNTISVADKQLRDAEKRGIRIILGVVALFASVIILIGIGLFIAGIITFPMNS